MNREHFLFLYSAVLFAIFLVYTFYCDHKVQLSDEWTQLFIDVGVDPQDIDRIQHDDDVWYIDGRSTCVGYGAPGGYCDYRTVYCTKGIPPHTNHGDMKEQVLCVCESLFAKGQHIKCPLLYSSAN